MAANERSRHLLLLAIASLRKLRTDTAFMMKNEPTDAPPALAGIVSRLDAAIYEAEDELGKL